MGDRCYLWLRTTRESALEVFNEVIGTTEYASLEELLTKEEEETKKYSWCSSCGVESSDETSVTITDEQSNYGAYSVRENLAAAGHLFFGYHEAGGEYGASLFYSDGKDCYDWESGSGGEGYVIQSSSNSVSLNYRLGKPNLEQLALLETFIEGHNKVVQSVSPNRRTKSA